MADEVLMPPSALPTRQHGGPQCHLPPCYPIAVLHHVPVAPRAAVTIPKGRKQSIPPGDIPGETVRN